MTMNNLLNSAKTREKKIDRTIWLISPQKHPDINSTEIKTGHLFDSVIEYRVSELGLYMLNPNPIKVIDTLVGCKVVYKKPTSTKIINKAEKLLRWVFPKKSGNDPVVTHEEIVISDCETRVPNMEDASLQRHVEKVKELLKPYDSLIEKISELDPDRLSDIVGVSEDPEGNRSLVHLKGSTAEKIRYIIDNIQQKTEVILQKSYMGNGLFEMRGFDFTSYNPEKSFRLIIATQKDRSSAFVLSPAGSVTFQVQDLNLLKYLQYLQFSLKTNMQLKNLLHQCVAGTIEPLRLFFNNNLEIDYFKTDLPIIYQELLQAEYITSSAKNIVVKALNQKQLGILMNYLPKPKHGRNNPITNVYVMHDVKALEPVKSILPRLYNEIDQKIGTLESGKYYLMDSMKGYNNAK